MSLRPLVAFVTLLTLLISTELVRAESGGPHADAPPELAALAFLIGDWDLETSFALPDGTRRTAAARLQARYALGGFGILVEETHGFGQGQTFVGGVLYTVDPKTRRIVGASNNTLGNRKQLEVTVEDDRIVIVQSGELFDDRKGFNRHTLSEIGPDRYVLRLDACAEDGETCTENTYSYRAARRTTAIEGSSGDEEPQSEGQSRSAWAAPSRGRPLRV